MKNFLLLLCVSLTLFADALIPVDTSQDWIFRGEIRCTEGMAVASVGLECADQNKKPIFSHMVNGIFGTETELLQDLKQGDTFLLLKDCSNWQPKWGKILAINAKKDHSDIPNKFFVYYIKTIQKEGTAWKITLDRPAQHAAKAGTLVRHHSDAGAITALWKQPISEQWRPFSHLISRDEAFNDDGSHFWPGTRFAKPFSFSLTQGKKIQLRNVSLTPVASSEYQKLWKKQQFQGIQLLPFGTYAPRMMPDNTEGFFIKAQSGYAKNNLRIPISQIAQIEFQMQATAPGMLKVIMAGDDNGKWFFSDQSFPAIPDGKPHWNILTIDPDKFPPNGILSNLELGWRNWNDTDLTIRNFIFRKSPNCIPGTEAIIPQKPVLLEFFTPGKRYELSWKGGENPGLHLHWLDQDHQIIGSTELSKGQFSTQFLIPPQAVQGTLTIQEEGRGEPVLAPITSAPLWNGYWIWNQKEEGPDNTNIWFKREFTLPEGNISQAQFGISADDESWTYLNGTFIGETHNFMHPKTFNVRKLLKPGKNTLTIRVLNGTNVGGLLCCLRFQQNEKISTLVSDGEWKMHIGGTEKAPEEISQPVLVIGKANTLPWGAVMGKIFIGDTPQLQISSVQGNEFIAESNLPLGNDLPKSLRYQLRSSSGIQEIRLDTEIICEGNRFRFKHLPVAPLAAQEQRLYLNDEHFELLNNPCLAIIPPAPQNTGLAKAEFLFEKGRTFLKFNGKTTHPLFWAPPGAFAENYLNKIELFAEATRAGFDNFQITTNFPKFWIAPGKYNFSSLDAYVQQLLTYNPNARFLLSIGCYMPDWWLKQNPTETAARENGTPRNLAYERQALGSQKWLQDSKEPLCALIEHIRRSAWGNRVWATTCAENLNWEWFWWRTGNNLTGYSPADKLAFQTFLKNKYQTNARLAAAWNNPKVTFDTIELPKAPQLDTAACGTLQDASRNQQLIDWFTWRNDVIANAFITLCHIIKEASQGNWITGGYYGYYVELCQNTGWTIHNAGHNGWWKVVNSPDVDYVRAPSRYAMRRLGASDGIMQLADTFTGHKKVVYLECDHRTSIKFDHKGADHGISRMVTLRQSIDILNRAFGMALSSGICEYWYDITVGGLSNPALSENFRKIIHIWETLPPVANATPKEIALVGNDQSIYYTKQIGPGSVICPIWQKLTEMMPRSGFAFSQLSINDLLDGTAAPHKLYIIADSFMLTPDQRSRLMKRFSTEKSSVLWLYAPGAIYPGQSPSAQSCCDFLGIQTQMNTSSPIPAMKHAPAPWKQPMEITPWFQAVSGYDTVLENDIQNKPLVVSKKIQGATHIFSTAYSLPYDTIQKIALASGAHQYTASTEDIAWIGNDVIFIHANTSSLKQLRLPKGKALKRLIGPLDKEYIQSNEPWPAEGGVTYGFSVIPATDLPSPKETRSRKSPNRSK